MSKLFLFFTFLYAITFPFEVTLKKDEFLKFDVRYENKTYPFLMRWTLYKNDILTLLYRYDNFPRQITLYKDYPLNTFRVQIVNYDSVKTPYFLVEFVNFKDENATFKFYLFNGEGVKVERK